MASDKLYKLAFEYKKTKLWKKLWDNEIFAVKFSDGEIGYVSIMGKGGTYTAVAVYVGARAFQTYREIQEGEKLFDSYFKEREHLTCQNCLQLAFENKEELRDVELKEAREYAKRYGIRFAGKNSYPQFLNYVPCRFPWNTFSEKEEMYLEETLEATIEIAGQLNRKTAQELGIREISGETRQVICFEKSGNKYRTAMEELPLARKKQFLKPEPLDDFTLASLKRIKKKEVFECELVYLPEPVQNLPDEQPFFPLMLMMVSKKDGLILPINIVKSYEENLGNLLRYMAESLKNLGRRPGKLLVRDERTFAFLDEFGRQMQAEVRIESSLPELDEAQESMIEEFWVDEDIEGNVSDFLQILDAMEGMPDEVLCTMPDEMLEQLEFMADSHMLPPDLLRRVEDILDRMKEEF